MINLVYIGVFSTLCYVSYTVWFPTVCQCIVHYEVLMAKLKKSSIFTKIWASTFYFIFLVPCALFTNDRLHHFFWLFGFLVLKNAAYHTESFAVCIFTLFYVMLLFEHLLFAWIYHSSQFVKSYFTSLFGYELLFYCLGNMWKAPAKKIGTAAVMVCYEAGVDMYADTKGTEYAKSTLQDFPNQTLQEHIATKNQQTALIKNYWSIAGNFGTLMTKIFK